MIGIRTDTLIVALIVCSGMIGITHIWDYGPRDLGAYLAKVVIIYAVAIFLFWLVKHVS